MIDPAQYPVYPGNTPSNNEPPYESSGTSSTRAPLLSGRELPESAGLISRTLVCALPLRAEDAPEAADFDFDLDAFSGFSDFSVRFFLLFFLGRSHSHRGINDST